MPRPSTFTPEIAATIIGSRRVGATLRVAARAAGVPWRTLCDWMKAGRAGDKRLVEFVKDLDKAAAQFEQVLRARVMRGTEADARLAFDILRWNELRPEREAKLRALKAQATVDEKRAEGTLVDRHEHSMRDPLDELRRRLAQGAPAAEAGGDPREPEQR